MDWNRLEEFTEDFFKDYSHVRLDKWNYEDGCILTAALGLYEATRQKEYLDFVTGYLEAYVEEGGSIRHYRQEDYNLDNICPGRGLSAAWEQTGNRKYAAAAEKLLEQLKNQPRTEAGNFWHKKIYPNQVWLDGLYMAQPFYTACSGYRNGEFDEDILSQFENVRRHMFHEGKKLYYHGYDETRSVFWADGVTGCSANFWLRAEGWYLMAVTDTIEELCRRGWKETAAQYPGQGCHMQGNMVKQLADLYREGLDGLLKYRERSTGLFYQVIDRPDLEGNYLETSGSAMTAASVFKACRQGILPGENYWDIGREILQSLVEHKLVRVEGRTVLTDVCRVAGLGPEPGRRDGSAAYYLSEPRGYDDNKGNAALFMAYAQYLMGKGE